jgi:hypothetical protein
MCNVIHSYSDQTTYKTYSLTCIAILFDDISSSISWTFSKSFAENLNGSWPLEKWCHHVCRRVLLLILLRCRFQVEDQGKEADTAPEDTVRERIIFLSPSPKI